MGLSFYDSDKDPLSESDVFRTFHDGKIGGHNEKLLYLRNDDAVRYYTNVNIFITGSLLPGWSIKLIEGERRPTEGEWGQVLSLEVLQLEDIGSVSSGDASTYTPFWIRVYCPGGEPAKIYKSLKIYCTSLERIVGS